MDVNSMPLGIYAVVFICFAGMFVPIPIEHFCIPAIALPFVASRFDIHWELQGANVAAFLFVFYFAANITYWLSTLRRSRIGKAAIQVIFLLLVISFSFLPAITYDDGALLHKHKGGNYTFWSAVSRYFETKEGN